MTLTNVLTARVSTVVAKTVFYGVKIENYSVSPDTTITISGGATVSSSDSEDIIQLPSDTNLDITVLGAGGLDAGPEEANTWYYIWLIKKPDGTVSGLLSSSQEYPIVPLGYTFKALIGAVRNDGSSNFLRFRQVGKKTNFITQQQVYYNTSAHTTFVAIDPSSYVPVNIAGRAFIVFHMGSESNGYTYLAPGTQTGGVGGIKIAETEEESELSVNHVDCILGFDGKFSVRFNISALVGNKFFRASIFGFKMN